MARPTASFYLKFVVIGSSKRTVFGRLVWLVGYGIPHKIPQVIWARLNPVQEWLNLKNFFQCRLLCHECRADKDTYMRRALHGDRYTLDEFFAECLKPGEVCSWAENPLSWKIIFGLDWYCFHLFTKPFTLFCSPKKYINKGLCCFSSPVLSRPVTFAAPFLHQ